MCFCRHFLCVHSLTCQDSTPSLSLLVINSHFTCRFIMVYSRLATSWFLLYVYIFASFISLSPIPWREIEVNEASECPWFMMCKWSSVLNKIKSLTSSFLLHHGWIESYSIDKHINLVYLLLHLSPLLQNKYCFIVISFFFLLNIILFFWLWGRKWY